MTTPTPPAPAAPSGPGLPPPIPAGAAAAGATRPPSGGAAGSRFAVIYRLVLRNQVTAGRLVAMAALGAVGVLLGLAVGVSSSSDRVDAGATIIDVYGLQLLAPVVALVFASSALGDLVDDHTLVYLWMRPVPRITVAGAAALAALTVCLPVVTVPLVASAALTGAGAALVGGTAVASLVGVTGYVGLFCALGLRFKRALVWGIAYILLWEGFVANASKTASRLSLRAYTRSVISEYTGVGLDQATLTLAVAILVPVAVAVAMVLYTGRRLARTDVD